MNSPLVKPFLANSEADLAELFQNSRMQSRAELYDLIGYHDYEALDASIVETVVPQGMPQR